MNFSENTRLVDLTVDEFREFLHEELGHHSTPVAKTGCSTAAPKRLIYGIKGIEEFFGVSHRTAQALKDGILKPAVSQNGRIIVTDADQALVLFNQNKRRNE